MIGTCLYVGTGLELDELRTIAAKGDVSAHLSLDMLDHMERVGWIDALPPPVSTLRTTGEEAVDPVDQEIRRQAAELARDRMAGRKSFVAS